MMARTALPALTGAVALGCLALFMVVTLIAGPDPSAQDVSQRLMAPGAEHLFGTDQLGRDFAGRVALAMRGSIATAAAVTLVSGVGGGLLGVLAGLAGERLDSIAQRIVDAVMAVPLIVIALAAVAAYGGGGWVVAGALSIAFAPLPYRVARASARSLSRSDFVDAARVAGAGRLRIATRHIGANAVGPWAAIVSAQAGGALLAESALSFLGVGGGRSLGALLAGEAQAFMHTAPWLALFPGAAIFLLALSVNLIGEGFVTRPGNR